MIEKVVALFLVLQGPMDFIRRKRMLNISGGICKLLDGNLEVVRWNMKVVR
ncbi:hypothetical protein [Sutcliffiella deserti]|uniref:hypothetical protein n=1 Tax=Sutcliffiella deserti TaxID=2875501 RepID=UPI001CBDAC43|nr:hypothetical protein [Sutcliffiella deserti]